MTNLIVRNRWASRYRKRVVGATSPALLTPDLEARDRPHLLEVIAPY